MDEKKHSGNVSLIYCSNLFHLHKHQIYTFEMDDNPHPDLIKQTNTVKIDVEKKLIMELVDHQR